MIFDRLRRTTNQGSFIPEIDGLRFFAIITVVFFHLNTSYSSAVDMKRWSYHKLDDFIPSLGWVFTRLDLGVKVFFAISGFILSLPFLRHYVLGEKKVDVGQYFLRRLKRLEPPFLVSLSAMFVAQMLLSWHEMDRGWVHFLTGILYSHVIVFGTANPINPVTWSLETEAQFYAIVPVLFWLVFRPKSRIVRVVLLLLLMWISIRFRTRLYWDEESHLKHFVLTYLANFLVGTFMAWLYLESPWLFRRKNFAWDLLGVFSLWLMFHSYKPQYSVIHNFRFNASIIGLFLSVFNGRAFNAFFTSRPVYTIGGMCYSIYLLHYAFFFILIPRTAGLTSGMPYGQGFILQCLIAIPAMLVVCTVFYLLFEKPCMDKDWPTKLSAWIRSSFRKTVRA